MNLTIDDFEQFFEELHGHGPYDWQRRLAKEATTDKWPSRIDLPTGCGKTACLDIAVFSLACQASLDPSQRTAPCRMFFCVNRRVIVDEAHQRATRIAKEIWAAERAGKPVLTRVAKSLRRISGIDHCLRPWCVRIENVAKSLRRISGIDGKRVRRQDDRGDSVPPLDVLELRGGIYRDNRWARSATQPTIICTTVDQLGSRLLFRGYGVSSGAAPIQAALIAYDSLVLLDEAHISRPFEQTLKQVHSYLDHKRWLDLPIGMNPMVFVPMTATPADGAEESKVIRLSDKDRENEGLNRRLTASKPAELRIVGEKKLIDEAVSDATRLTGGTPAAVGIIVNRVATAKAVYQRLQNEHHGADVHLVIGSMRPVDRDLQAEQLRELIGPARPTNTQKTSFVVATQCLEVGADYDFDVLITECASLDALRQRFGRLNRGGRPIAAKAVILAADKAVKEESKLDDKKPLDPIYGNALARTWHWLSKHSVNKSVELEKSPEVEKPKKGKTKNRAAGGEDRSIDFGIDSFNELLKKHGDDGSIPNALLSPSAKLDAPVVLPAYLDLWCQTSPSPVPDPEVSLFIHGVAETDRDVQVCWRADLVENEHLDKSNWCDIVSLLPPTAAECMSVPMSRLRRWLTTDSQPDGNKDSDLLGERTAEGEASGERTRLCKSGVLWKGAQKSELLSSISALYRDRGCTLVLPESKGGWNELGHIPPDPVGNRQAESDGDSTTTTSESDDETNDTLHHVARIDVAEKAFLQAKGRAALRLHPALMTPLPSDSAFTELFTRLADPDDRLSTKDELRDLLKAARDFISPPNSTDVLIPDLLRALDSADVGLQREDYPDRRGIVLTLRKRLERPDRPEGQTDWFIPSLDDGDDEPSKTQREKAVSLRDHTEHVKQEMLATLKVVSVGDLNAPLSAAAARHDWGKADERFQALLRRMDRTDVWQWSTPDAFLLAKSDSMSLSQREREAARRRAELPAGFRHEMLSVQMAEHCPSLQAMDSQSRDLVLHLTAAHHGMARPFAPVVDDPEPPEVTFEGLTLSPQDRLTMPPHRLDSGIAERFWLLTKRYGWWGLAYLEALLRLADQQASANEDAGVYENEEQLAAEVAQ